MEKLIKVKQILKKKKPKFQRQQTNQYSKLKNKSSWRRPKGLQSKLRLRKRGHRKIPTVGFKTPKKLLNLNSLNKIDKIVHNIFDLDKLKDAESPIISKTVGRQKKILLLKEIKKRGLKLSNISDVDKKLNALLSIKKKKSRNTKILNLDKKVEPKSEDKNEIKSLEGKKSEKKTENVSVKAEDKK